MVCREGPKRQLKIYSFPGLKNRDAFREPEGKTWSSRKPCNCLSSIPIILPAISLRLLNNYPVATPQESQPIQCSPCIWKSQPSQPPGAAASSTRDQFPKVLAKATRKFLRTEQAKTVRGWKGGAQV